jgi:hypothetical protein
VIVFDRSPPLLIVPYRPQPRLIDNRFSQRLFIVPYRAQPLLIVNRFSQPISISPDRPQPSRLFPMRNKQMKNYPGGP